MSEARKRWLGVKLGLAPSYAIHSADTCPICDEQIAVGVEIFFDPEGGPCWHAECLMDACLRYLKGERNSDPDEVIISD